MSALTNLLLVEDRRPQKPTFTELRPVLRGQSGLQAADVHTMLERLSSGIPGIQFECRVETRRVFNLVSGL